MSLHGGGGVSSQMNKFEQVSNDHHQMSLAGEGVGPQGWCLGDGVSPQVWCAGGVPYHVTYFMLPTLTDRQTPVKTLPSINLY